MTIVTSKNRIHVRHTLQHEVEIWEINNTTRK